MNPFDDSRGSLEEKESQTPSVEEQHEEVGMEMPPRQTMSFESARASKFREHLQEGPSEALKQEKKKEEWEEVGLSDSEGTPRQSMMSMRSTFSSGFPDSWGKVIDSRLR